ncbi:pentatricopeptide repeat-containing protein At5g65560 [Rosa chinensis]|uniref:pentatricopeptide repeat-containing protein At5g65560 n=1 Tax=Rosa chinensis TaxID=74649 RepID=UPI000D088CEC|nr:pentatricopeptide repeat-containing protein At5g65560 [Rosa chinensis]
MEDTSFPNSSADVMKVFKDATKDCEDKVLKKMFDSIGDYDSLNKFAFQFFGILVNFGIPEEAKELFKPRSQLAVLPDAAIFTIVILAYANAGKTKAAHKVYQQMIATGVAPTSCTYTILIMALATDSSSDAGQGDEAKKCLLEMMDKGMRPNAATYTAVIESFAKQEDEASEEECKEFVEVMVGKGFVPNSKAMREVLKGRPTPLVKRVRTVVLSKLKG